MSLLVYATNEWSECFMEPGPTRLGMSTTAAIANLWLAFRNDSLERVIRDNPIAQWLIDGPDEGELVETVINGKVTFARWRRGANGWHVLTYQYPKSVDSYSKLWNISLPRSGILHRN